MALILFGATACNATAQAPTPTATLIPPTATAVPSETPEPTATHTPEPTATATAEPTNTPTETLEPTDTPEPTATFTPEATATPEVAIQPTALDVVLNGIVHDYQRLNNCGPVSTSMALSYYGSTLTQYDIAPVVKGGPTDTNAAPHELSAYVADQGFLAPVLYNGNPDILRALISNGIPVIVEQWLERPDDELTAHYRVVKGYNSTEAIWIVDDSYTGPNRRYSEADFDRWWIPFNRVYMPVIRPDQEPLVRAIVGEIYDNPQLMWQQTADRALAELDVTDNPHSWYNLGEARFKLGELDGAISAFESSFTYQYPYRLQWYIFTYMEAYNEAGMHQRVLDLTAPYAESTVEEIFYQRGVALEALGRPDEALQSYQQAVTLNARLTVAAEAVARLGG
jgi:hypothetical protein